MYSPSSAADFSSPPGAEAAEEEAALIGEAEAEAAATAAEAAAAAAAAAGETGEDEKDERDDVGTDSGDGPEACEESPGDGDAEASAFGSAVEVPERLAAPLAVSIPGGQWGQVSVSPGSSWRGAETGGYTAREKIASSTKTGK
jgi:hypothetical protein